MQSLSKSPSKFQPSRTYTVPNQPLVVYFRSTPSEISDATQFLPSFYPKHSYESSNTESNAS